jgi:hypothetical protein
MYTTRYMRHMCGACLGDPETFWRTPASAGPEYDTKKSNLNIQVNADMIWLWSEYEYNRMNMDMTSIQ